MNVTNLICPIENCTATFDDGDALTGHVATRAQEDEDHHQQKQSNHHNPEWYKQNCVDENQSTLL